MVKPFNELYPSKDNSPFHSASLLKRILRIIYDSVRGFIEDDCYSKASALTYYSLLSIVPVLAVLFGIAKGFGFEQALEKEIIVRFSEQREVMDRLIQFAYTWLHNAKGGIIAGIGTVVLLWSILGLLSNVENALNAIWKIPVGRSYSRKISDYLASMLICPIFFVTSSSITVFLSTQIEATAHSNVIAEAVSPLLLYILKLFPYFLSWVLFTFIYLFMPEHVGLLAVSAHCRFYRRCRFPALAMDLHSFSNRGRKLWSGLWQLRSSAFVSYLASSQLADSIGRGRTCFSDRERFVHPEPEADFFVQQGGGPFDYLQVH